MADWWRYPSRESSDPECSQLPAQICLVVEIIGGQGVYR